MTTWKDSLRTTIVALCAVATMPLAMAHPHPEDFSENDMIDMAIVVIHRLVTESKLPKSWDTQAKVESAQLQRKPEGRDVWVIKFSNPTIKGSAKNVYIVRLNEYGDYVDSSFANE